jgi:hypothetical protein
MKRHGKLYETISSIQNLRIAEKKARKGKAAQYGVRIFDQNAEHNLLTLHYDLINLNFKTSKYTTFKIFEPKEREVYRLPYYPDRIVHHAIMNVLEPIFNGLFTADTYSCIKGRGIHGALRKLKTSLKDIDNTKFCLKLDIRKFYPSVDHQIMKNIIRRKFKDKDLLIVFDEIIESAPGLPIGNYLSQYLANLYLTYFDYWIKGEMKVKYYFRYADDLVILGANKEELHHLLSEIRNYLKTELKLDVKSNYQVFPVSARGIDFVGYRVYHTHVLLRKGIKKRFARMLAKNPNRNSIFSYWGWAKHANSTHLIKTLFNDNENILSNGHKAPNKSLYGRQSDDKPDFEPGNSSTQVQNSTINTEQRERLPTSADRTKRNEKSIIYRFLDSHSNDSKGSGRRFSVQNDNNKRK